MREGTAVEDFFHPDRIVVGVENSHAADQMYEIYQPVLEKTVSCPVHGTCKAESGTPFLVTDTNSAELIKHASNSFLAMKISFINMVADICESAGGDIAKVAEGIGLDKRIGQAFLRPGIGFGGFCVPKDLQAFVRIAEKFRCDFRLLKEVERINQNRTEKFVTKIKNELWVLRGKRICVLGLAFKPDTDDIRYAPSVSVVRQLLSEGACVRAYDPQAMGNAQREVPHILCSENIYDAATDAEAILVLTEWDEFRSADWDRLRCLVHRPLIIDGRNFLEPDIMKRHGFQ